MKILVAGDFCPQYRVTDEFEKDNFSAVLGDVRDINSTIDYSIVNFECPVKKDGNKPIVKCGPNLYCSRKGIEALKWAGFDCVTLANNHILDFGKDGILNMLEECKTNEIDTVGAGINLYDASKVLYKSIEGKKLAIINCCEHEFSIATEESAGANPLNTVRQYYTIEEARNNADFVLLIVHGGHEHYQLPSARMQDTYRFFIDLGVDAVVNHHQHCFSGYEIYKGKPIFYGLGNFCFDYPEVARNNSNWGYGYMVAIDFSQSEINFILYPYEQCISNSSVTLLAKDVFDKQIKGINSIINDRSKLIKEQCHYFQNQNVDIISAFQPIRNRFILSAQRHGLLPSFMSKRWQTILYNMIVCESHQEKVKYYFECNFHSNLKHK